MLEERQLNYEDIVSDTSQRTAGIKSQRIPVSVLTDGIKNPGNLGMIFRLADALRLEKVYLYNIGKDFNFKLLNKKSRSTLKYVPYQILNSFDEVSALKKDKYFVVLDKTNMSIDYTEFKPVTPLCLIAGSEKFGVSEELIKISDISVHLPANGVNTSINAATATAVALFDFYNKIKK
ncbi:MAG: TrmH family RNA methyltransferase [Chlorobi bacterium]|nr:TrmH family RNA methyltransferase [Chlorobiota bacterium]